MEMERRKMGAGWRAQLSLLFCTGSCCLIYYNNQETFFFFFCNGFRSKEEFFKRKLLTQLFLFGHFILQICSHVCEMRYSNVTHHITGWISKSWKQPQYPLTGDCRNKSRDHTWWSIVKVEKRMSKHVMQL